MDACCERISRLLCQDGQYTPRSLAKLVEKSGLARSTAMFHLKHLEEGSLLTKEEILQTRVGRPKILYTPSEALLDRYRTKSD